MFYECFNAVTGETGRPRAWGEKVGAEYKAQLLDDGWHTQICPADGDENDDNEDVTVQEQGALHPDKGRNCWNGNVKYRMVGGRTSAYRSSALSSSAAACIGGFKSILREV
jgi:hypothetical protein